MLSTVSNPSDIQSTKSLMENPAEKTIIWFRNDLRIQDNYVLSQAIANTRNQSSGSSDLFCFYCFDPQHYGSESITPFGSKKIDIYRAKFILESVANLRHNLRLLGNDLHVAYDKPENVIRRILSLNSDDGNNSMVNVYVQKEVTSEEISAENRVEKVLQQSSMITTTSTTSSSSTTSEFTHKLHRIEGNQNLYHVNEVKKVFKRVNLSDMPDTFTPVKEKLEKHCRIASLPPIIRSLPSIPNHHIVNTSTDSIETTTSIDHGNEGYSYLPTLEILGFTSEDIAKVMNPDSRGVMIFTGGEDEGRKRMQSWMFDHDNLKDYFDIRNGMLGEKYSSKFSPWLAVGCLSPRQIYHEIKRYELERRIANKSTYWLIFELTWRDFFFYLGLKYGNDLFKVGGAHRVSKPWNRDIEIIRRWKTGMTGQPLVDANMRELMTTGWMSNRGRQNVASYLVLDLGIDWRIGADHFESLLLDHDVTSNYGNWNAAAGLTGGRINRFNIVKQSKDYDPHGEYIKHWLPELRNVPVPMLFEPWTLSKSEQERYGVSIGPDGTYPLPIEISSNKLHDRTYNRDYTKHSDRGGDDKGSYSRGKMNSSKGSTEMTGTGATGSTSTINRGDSNKRKNRVQHL